MRIIKLEKHNSKEVIDSAVKVLQDGGLVIYPTETVYGIGADATNASAIAKLNLYKTMRKDKPYSIVVADQPMAEEYVELNDTAIKLYQKYLPGALTIISQGKHKVASGVESPTGSLGIRIPDFDIVLEISKSFGKPFTATSANASYKKKPYKIDDILNNLSNKQKLLIDLIIDAGTLPHNPPSTVLDTTLDDVHTTRIGAYDFRFQNSFTSTNEQDTYKLADELLKKNLKYLDNKSLIFALQGEMGAGKTYFTKGLAKALSIEQVIQSPTFVLSREYPFEVDKISGKLFHIDTWRIYEKQELMNLGLEQMILPGNIISMEWADKFTEVVASFGHKAVIIWLDIQKKGLNKRIIKF